jgi:hypothetical protein
MMFLLRALTIACATFLFACSDGDDRTGQVQEQGIVVTREAQDLPEGCGVREVARVLVDLTDALSRGDVDATDSVFAPEKGFASVGVAHPGGLTGDATLDRESLTAYLQERIDQNESYDLRVVKVANDVGGSPLGGEMVRFDLLAERSADDVGPTPVETRGWGELACPDKEIYLLNLGPVHPREDTDAWCPDTESGGGQSVVVACSAD